MNELSIKTIRQDEDLKQYFYHDTCDKYDYLIAVGCGAIAGMVDIFLVGSPADSKLQGWTDAQVDKTVMAFAKTCGWEPREGKEKSVASAIGFLEKKFPVNYDQRHSGDVGGLFTMSAKNHHMKSLAHSPDIIGLFFSTASIKELNRMFSSRVVKSCIGFTKENPAMLECTFPQAITALDADGKICIDRSIGISFSHDEHSFHIV